MDKKKKQYPIDAITNYSFYVFCLNERSRIKKIRPINSAELVEKIHMENAINIAFKEMLI